MPSTIDRPHGQVVLETETLSQSSFSAFGTVIENPAPSLVPSLHINQIPKNALLANQGTALKYLDVTHMKDLYDSAPSNQPSRAVMNLFVCAPRSLLPSLPGNVAGLFPVEILERHPFTTQTFIPLGLSPSTIDEARYIVIVAPTLPSSSGDAMLPVPTATKGSGPLPGRGFPDLKNVKAFIAKGSQAVTYGAGTWHAPMVVVGERPANFVVVQFANGVGLEDCQEVDWKFEKGTGISVAIPKAEPVQTHGLWKL